MPEVPQLRARMLQDYLDAIGRQCENRLVARTPDVIQAIRATSPTSWLNVQLDVDMMAAVADLWREQKLKTR
ncbi:MAG: hypothetical protein GY822_14390 [Deltaproteobacteria bacterium]|nr:hypothetical protein [Deltaproteobacteria bacterium]